MKRCIKSYITGVLLVLFFLPATYGGLIFYESFLDGGSAPDTEAGEYDTSGSPPYIHGQGPDIVPFIGTWAQSDHGDHSTLGARLEGASLSFANYLASRGTAVRWGRFGTGGGHSQTLSRYTDHESMEAPDSKVYYGAFIFYMNEQMLNAGSGSHLYVQYVFRRKVSEGSGGTRSLRIGINGSNQLYIESTGHNSAGPDTSTAAVTTHSVPHLVVFRMYDRDHPDNAGSTEAITAWLNPDLSEAISNWSNPLTANYNLLRTVSNTNVLERLIIQRTISGDHQYAAFDEFILTSNIDTPTVQASDVQFANVLADEMTVSWTRGSGFGAIVVVKEGAEVDQGPEDGETYSASTEFGEGDEVGDTFFFPGNYVVYAGTGNEIVLTGLSAVTTYHVAVYEYGGLNGRLYLGDPARGQQATIGAGPELSQPTVAQVGVNTAILGATIDDDKGEAIIERGTVWSSGANPNLDDDVERALAEGGTATGAFSHERSGLPAGSLIYYRGYATTASGTGYSGVDAFYTEPADPAQNIGAEGSGL